MSSQGLIPWSSVTKGDPDYPRFIAQCLEEDVLNSTADERPEGHEFASAVRCWECPEVPRDPLLTWLVQSGGPSGRGISGVSQSHLYAFYGQMDANGANVFHCHFDPDRRCGAELSSSSPVRGDPAAQIATGLWDWSENVQLWACLDQSAFKLGRLGYAWLDIQLDMCSVYGTSESNSSSSLSMKFWSTNRLAFGQLELPIRAATQKRGSTTRVG